MRELFSFFHQCELILSEIVFLAFVHDPPDLPLFCFRDVQRSIRTHCNTHRPIDSIAYADNRIDFSKSIRKHFPLAGWFSMFKWHEAYKVPGLWIRGTVSRTVKSDKRSLLIPLRILVSRIKEQIIRSPMARKSHNGHLELITSPHTVAVTTVLRSQYFFSFDLIIVTVRPPEVGTVCYLNKFF